MTDSRIGSDLQPEMVGVDADPRRLIHQALGAGARIRALREAPAPGPPIFVVDLDDGPRHQRLLGTLRPAPAADPELTALSAMDLIFPSRLVLDYERLMALAFALCDRTSTALLLGVGGAAMWRFVRAHLPECDATLVEKDEDIAALARRWFYLTQQAVVDTAEAFLARTPERFDAILVDLYDARGAATPDADFWARCLDALAPGGCLATNWPKFVIDGTVRASIEAQVAMARARGRDCFFITRRCAPDNILQYLPTADGCGPDTVAHALERFATERHLPGGNRILEDQIISSTFPIAG